jgi:phosphoesterase RecJ-like protein
MVNLEVFKGALTPNNKIIITTHYKPDGDALGSALGVYHWLKNKGLSVEVVVPSDFPAFLDFLPGREMVHNYLTQPSIYDSWIAEADLIFCLDFNGLSRINAMETAVRRSKAIKVMVDHHLEPEGFDDARYWDPQAAATAQLVYGLISKVMEESNEITADIATCLYTGIMTDTGSFRFRSTTDQVHEVIADLLRKGAPNTWIHEQVYNSSSENRLKFLGHCLLNRLEVLPAYNTAIFAVSQEDLALFDVVTGETEGLVNYALSLKGIQLAALIIDRGELIKLSLRSVGTFPCNELCRDHFNGGGHLNAAGGSATGNLEGVVARFKAILPLYQHMLIK